MGRIFLSTYQKAYKEYLCQVSWTKPLQFIKKCDESVNQLTGIWVLYRIKITYVTIKMVHELYMPICTFVKKQVLPAVIDLTCLRALYCF